MAITNGYHGGFGWLRMRTTGLDCPRPLVDRFDSLLRLPAGRGNDGLWK
jgi:hypothetical protein